MISFPHICEFSSFLHVLHLHRLTAEAPVPTQNTPSSRGPLGENHVTVPTTSSKATALTFCPRGEVSHENGALWCHLKQQQQQQPENIECIGESVRKLSSKGVRHTAKVLVMSTKSVASGATLATSQASKVPRERQTQRAFPGSEPTSNTDLRDSRRRETQI